MPVTDPMLQKPSDGDWLMWRRTLDGWGYSPLKQINTAQRRAAASMVWTRELDRPGQSRKARRSSTTA